MCYSSLVNRELKKTAARHRAKINIDAFVDLYAMRVKNPALKIPLGMDDGAIDLGGMAGKSIAKHIRDFRTGEDARVAQALSDLHAEIAELEAKLAVKITKTAQDKLDAKLRKREKLIKPVADLSNSDTYRIYPFYFAPVVVNDGAGRELIPMRFRVLPRYGIEIPANKNVFNARRDSLQIKRTWIPLFGKQHAVFPFHKFYEWVEPNGRKVELSFSPDGYDDMWAVSLYEECKTEHGIIRSFAMITDMPPSEISAAGHDRVPVFLDEKLIDAWLLPAGKTLVELDAMLDNKQPTYYSHTLAA